MRVYWAPEIAADLQWWMKESNLRAGVDLQTVNPEFLLYTDASTQGWRCPLLHHTMGGLWSEEESTLHINVLELRAIRLALQHFQGILHGRTVTVMADSTTALAYITHQGRDTLLTA